MINLNIGTILIHLVLFLVMVGLLNSLLISPLLRVMDARENKVKGDQAAADRASREAEELKTAFQEKLDTARKEATRERDSVRAAAVAEEEKIIRVARDRSGDMVGELRKKIAAEYQGAREQLVSQSKDMGRTIAARILGRAV